MVLWKVIQRLGQALRLQDQRVGDQERVHLLIAKRRPTLNQSVSPAMMHSSPATTIIMPAMKPWGIRAKTLAA